MRIGEPLWSVLFTIALHHLSKHHLLCDTQYGFREKMSRVDMLSYITQWWNNALNTQQEIRVPLGSILGPVLFLMFTDDLVSHLENDIHLFADGSTLHIVIKNMCDRIICAESLQCDFNKIEGWADGWCVTFNVSKTEEMIISRKRCQNHPPLHFMNKELQPTDSITLLCVTITNTLSWSQHITCIAKKTAKSLYILGRSRNLLPHQACITIYKAYIRPLMEYASAIWNGAGTTSL